jgi:hypothetical protein
MGNVLFCRTVSQAGNQSSTGFESPITRYSAFFQRENRFPEIPRTRKYSVMKTAFRRVASPKSVVPPDNGRGQDSGRQKREGGQCALDNMSHTVYSVGSGSFRLPCRQPDPHPSGHRPDRSDRPLAAGTENSLRGRTPNNSELALYPRTKGFESSSFQGNLRILKDAASADNT